MYRDEEVEEEIKVNIPFNKVLALNGGFIFSFDLWSSRPSI